jgi:hypothetical protein
MRAKCAAWKACLASKDCSADVIGFEFPHRFTDMSADELATILDKRAQLHPSSPVLHLSGHVTISSTVNWPEFLTSTLARHGNALQTWAVLACNDLRLDATPLGSNSRLGIDNAEVLLDAVRQHAPDLPGLAFDMIADKQFELSSKYIARRCESTALRRVHVDWTSLDYPQKPTDNLIALLLAPFGSTRCYFSASGTYGATSGATFDF